MPGAIVRDDQPAAAHQLSTLGQHQGGSQNNSSASIRLSFENRMTAGGSQGGCCATVFCTPHVESCARTVSPSALAVAHLLEIRSFQKS